VLFYADQNSSLSTAVSGCDGSRGIEIEDSFSKDQNCLFKIIDIEGGVSCILNVDLLNRILLYDLFPGDLIINEIIQKT